MAYNAAYSESWGHYRDGGGSYYEDIQSSLASKSQTYAEPSRTKTEDYKYAPFHPDNVAHHQRELEQWSHGKAPASQGGHWYREPARGSPAPHPSQATDTYNPYGSRTMAHPAKQETKYDSPVRRQRSRSMSPAAKRHRYEDDGYYGRGKEEYHGGNASYNGGYDRQRATGPTSLRDTHQATQYSQPAYTSPSSTYPSSQYPSQGSSQSNSYGYNTGHYYTANYRPSYPTSPVRPPRINRPEIQGNIRQGPNSHHTRAPRPVFGGKSVPPAKRHPVPSPPKKAVGSSVPKSQATGKAPVKPGTVGANGKTPQQDEDVAERKRAKKRARRQEQKEKFAVAKQEAAKTGQSAKSDGKPMPVDGKKKPFPHTPDVIILGNSKATKKAEPAKSNTSGPAQEKHGFFSRVLSEITKPEKTLQKTDTINGTPKTESSAVKAVQNDAVKPSEASTPMKPTTVQSVRPPITFTAPKPSPPTPRSVSPVKPKGPEEFTVTHNQIIIKRPRGQWSNWSNSQKIAAVRWLNAYPEGKIAQRLRDLGIPEDETLWPYFEDGVWIVPVVQMMTGAVVRNMIEPPVKDATEETVKENLDVSQRKDGGNVERSSTNVDDHKENISVTEQHVEPKSSEIDIPHHAGGPQKATVTGHCVEEKRDEREVENQSESRENEDEVRGPVKMDEHVEIDVSDKKNDSSILESSSAEPRVFLREDARDGSPEFEVPAGKVINSEESRAHTDPQDAVKANDQEELDGDDVVVDSADAEEDVVLDST